jgi:hypothetical protein
MCVYPADVKEPGRPIFACIYPTAQKRNDWAGMVCVYITVLWKEKEGDSCVAHIAKGGLFIYLLLLLLLMGRP